MEKINFEKIENINTDLIEHKLKTKFDNQTNKLKGQI